MYFLTKARQRKLEYTDKLGRKWRWDRVRKKYIYIRKDLSERKQKEKQPSKKEKLAVAFSYNTRKRQKATDEPSKIDYTAKDQPYKESGILIGRAPDTVLPKRNYLSADVKGKLRKHQADAVNLFLQKFKEGHKSTASFDGTGAGKTFQQIALSETYMEHNPNKKVLIVTENDHIVVDAFAKDGKVLGAKMTVAKSAEKLKEGGPGIYITTYRDLKNMKEAFDEVSLSVFDEAHNMKNADLSEKAKLGMQLMNKAEHNALYTATPVDRAHHLMYLCRAYNLNFKKIMIFLGYKRKGNRYFTNLPGAEIVNRFDAVFSSLTKEGLIVKREVPLDGLEMRIETVNLSKAHRAKYAMLAKHMDRELQLSTPQEIGLLKAKWLMRMRSFLEEAKVEHALKSIKQSLKEGRKAVLFASRVEGSNLKGYKFINYRGSTFLVKDKRGVAEESKITLTTGTLKKLSELLKKEGIEFSTIFGSQKDAAEQIKQFQKGSAQVLITTPQSGGTGVSLDDIIGDTPRTAIVMTPPFSAVDFIQMPGRVHRLSTKSKSKVVMLSTNTPVEEWNKNIIANKLLALGASVKGDYAALSIEDLERVESLPPGEAKKYLSQQKKKAQSIPTASQISFTLSTYKGAEAMKKALQLCFFARSSLFCFPILRKHCRRKIAEFFAKNTSPSKAEIEAFRKKNNISEEHWNDEVASLIHEHAIKHMNKAVRTTKGGKGWGKVKAAEGDYIHDRQISVPKEEVEWRTLSIGKGKKLRQYCDKEKKKWVTQSVLSSIKK